MDRQNFTRLAYRTLINRQQQQQGQNGYPYNPYNPVQTPTAGEIKHAETSALQKPGVIVGIVIASLMMLALGFVVLRVTCINTNAMKKDKEQGH